jgi:quinolinate synthase
VVAASDASGSTEAIRAAIAESLPGSRWAVGTEAAFVSRMAEDFPDKEIVPLRVSPCFNMSRITLRSLQASLLSIKRRGEGGPLLFRVEVAEEEKALASRALRSMLDIVEGRR